MRVHYYSQLWDRQRNLGDWLTVPILRALGYEPEPPGDDGPVLFGVGSILHHDHYELYPNRTLTVWGSGVGANPCPPDATRPTNGAKLDIRAVRGPITRQALCADVPMGDPALLLPALVSLPEPDERGEILFVGHCGQPLIVPDGFDAGVSMLVDEPDALKLVSRIANAKFVGSESLHGCIIAAAYWIPWAPCSPRAEPFKSGLNKWNDWLAFLGLNSLPCLLPDLTAALTWWKSTGRHAQVRGTKNLLNSFPHDLVSQCLAKS